MRLNTTINFQSMSSSLSYFFRIFSSLLQNEPVHRRSTAVKNVFGNIVNDMTSLNSPPTTGADAEKVEKYAECFRRLPSDFTYCGKTGFSSLANSAKFKQKRPRKHKGRFMTINNVINHTSIAISDLRDFKIAPTTSLDIISQISIMVHN